MSKKVNMGIIGGYQNGKSTLVNCLLDDFVAKTGGEGLSVTSILTRYIYGDVQRVDYYSRKKLVHQSGLRSFLSRQEVPQEVDEIVVRLWKPLLKWVNIIDTPGYNANDKDSETAMASLNNLDYVILLLTNKGMSMMEEEILLELNRRQLPFSILMNVWDKGGNSWMPGAELNTKFVNEVCGKLESLDIQPLPINKQSVMVCNLYWFWYASEKYWAEGEKKVQEMESEMNYFSEKKLKQPEVSVDFFLRESNFLPVRRSFEDSDDWDFPLESIRWKSAFHAACSDWERCIKQIVNKY